MFIQSKLWFFQYSCREVRVGPCGRLSNKKLMFLNCGAGEDSLRVPWTARSNQSFLKEISPECSLEGLMLKLSSNTLVTWCKELTHWKRPWSWERLKAGEAVNRGWDGWMASPTQRTWIYVRSRSWWMTGKPGVLQSMDSQTERHDWATE